MPSGYVRLFLTTFSRRTLRQVPMALMGLNLLIIKGQRGGMIAGRVGEHRQLALKIRELGCRLNVICADHRLNVSSLCTI